MIRTKDKHLILAVLNHPSIIDEYEGINGADLDVEECIYLWCEAGLFPCKPQGDRISCHSAILPEYRGKAGVEAGRAAIDWLKVNTDYHVYAHTFKTHRAARVYNNLIGLKRVGGDDSYAYYEV